MKMKIRKYQDRKIKMRVVLTLLILNACLPRCAGVEGGRGNSQNTKAGKQHSAAPDGSPSHSYFREDFEPVGSKDGIPHGWTVSSALPDADRGTFKRSANPLIVTGLDYGLRTEDPLRYYAISKPLNRKIRNLGRTLIVQFSLRFEQKEIICAGGYIKLLMGSELEPFKGESFDSRSDYALMFGPDICGTSRIHFILRGEQHTQMESGKTGTAPHSQKGSVHHSMGTGDNKHDAKSDNIFSVKHLPMKRAIELDGQTEYRSHMYTLAIYGADNTWEILVDDITRERGNLTDSFNFLPPLLVSDVSATKPLDWVDDEFVPAFGSAGKPDGYDDIPREIPDPEAEQPDLWSVEIDGEWIPPLVPNPEWRGDWEQELVRNPEFQGKWEAPLISNPEFKGPSAEKRVRELHAICKPCTHFGIDIWQMNAGTVFDDILITDSVAEAERARAAFSTKIASEIRTLTFKANEKKEKKEKKENARSEGDL